MWQLIGQVEVELTTANEQKDLSTTAKDMVNSTQKDINREFVPVIEQAVRHIAFLF